MNKILRSILLFVILYALLYGILYWIEYSAIQNNLLWNGYVITTNFSSPSSAVTMVNASWIVPKATPNILVFVLPAIGRYLQWVGIGGYNADPTVVQIGTSVYYLPDLPDPKVTYYAWYETYPNKPIQITNMTILSGDKIYAEVECISNCSTSKPTWFMYIKDESNNALFSNSVPFNSTREYGEWIVETMGSDSYSRYFVNLDNISFVNDYATIDNVTSDIGRFDYQKVNQAPEILNVSTLSYNKSSFVVTAK